MSTSIATSELTRLPGLEDVQDGAPSVEPAHAIVRAPEKRLIVVSGRSHPALAADIAEKLGVELSSVVLKTFPNSENYCRFEDSVRGADMFIVQTGHGALDKHLIELLQLIQAAKLASAKRITAVIPYFMYSRQDKKSRPREPITAKLVADLLQVAGVDRVLTMDLHAGQVQGFFDVPVDHMTALPMFAQYVKDLNLPEDLVVVAPDAGRTKLASKFAEMVGGDVAFINKERPEHSVAVANAVIGDVAGKCAVMSDDMIDTAGTLCAGAIALKEAGAARVIATATHALFSGPALERIRDSVFDSVIVTDTVPVDPLTKPDNVVVLPCSDILARSIHNVFADDSVSAIFAGENQLF